jgi:hypothetical protein
MSLCVDFLVEVEVEATPSPWTPPRVLSWADCTEPRAFFRNVERALVVLRALICRNSDIFDLKTRQRSDWSLFCMARQTTDGAKGGVIVTVLARRLGSQSRVALAESRMHSRQAIVRHDVS